MRVAYQAISPSFLAEVFDYDTLTGDIYWTASAFRDGRPRLASYRRGRGRGYSAVSFLGFQIPAHRVVWALVHATWPEGVIDHIDRDGTNNRICNLRAATPAENARNSSSRVGSSSQYLGVYYDKVRDKWRAQIQKGDEKFSLGRFATEDAAALAYNKAASRLFGDRAALNVVAR